MSSATAAPATDRTRARASLGAQPGEVEPQRVAARERLADLRERAGGLRMGPPGRHDHQPGAGRGLGEHVAQGAQRRVVGPVQVVEDDEDRVVVRGAGAAPARSGRTSRTPAARRSRPPCSAPPRRRGRSRRRGRGSAGSAATATAEAPRRPGSRRRSRRHSRGAAPRRPGRGRARTCRCRARRPAAPPRQGRRAGRAARSARWPGRPGRPRARPRPPRAPRRAAAATPSTAGPSSSAVSSQAVLAQDRLLEVAQLPAGVQSELLGEQLADGAQRVERVRLATGPGECERVQSPPPLLQGVGGHPRLGRRQDARVLAEREQAEQPGLLRRGAHLLERAPLGDHVGVLEQVGVRRPGPGGQHGVELVEGGDQRRCGPASPHGRRWSSWVASGARTRSSRRTSTTNRCASTSVGSHPQDVAVVGRLEQRRRRARRALGVEDLAQSGDVGMQRAVRRPRRLARPDQVGQQVRRHGPPCVQRERRHDRARLARADVEPLPRWRVPGDPDGAEHRHLHGRNVCQDRSKSGHKSATARSSP